jgi:hypothetical protein
VFVVCSNVYKRHDTYWWQRRLRLADGTRFAVAISLRTHDRKVARRLADQLSVKADEYMTQPGLTATDIKAALKAIVEIQRQDYADRLRRDVEELGMPPAYSKAADRSLLELTELFWGDIKFERLNNLASKYRVASALDRLAAAKGPMVAWSQSIEDEFRGEGLTTTEVDQIQAWIAAGYAVEAFRPDSAIAKTPSTAFAEKIAGVRVAGQIGSRDDVYAMLARERSVLAAATADRYEAAACGRHGADHIPGTDLNREILGEAWPSPPSLEKAPMASSQGADPDFSQDREILQNDAAAGIPLDGASPQAPRAPNCAEIGEPAATLQAAQDEIDSGSVVLDTPSAPTTSTIERETSSSLEELIASHPHNKGLAVQDAIDFDENHKPLEPATTLSELFKRFKRAKLLSNDSPSQGSNHRLSAGQL